MACKREFQEGRIRPLRSILIALILFVTPSAMGQSNSADQINSQIESLENAARQERELAARAAERAKNFGALEEAAQRTSDGATDATIKEVWKLTAEDYRDSRKHNEDERRRLEESAAQREAAAQRLRDQQARRPSKPESPGPGARGPTGPQPNPPNAAQGPRSRHADLVDFIGQWQDQERGVEVVLEAAEPHDPSQSGKVKLTGRKNVVWEGRVELGIGSTPTRFAFTHRPKWDEMNSDIPEWARRKVDGQLEWKLELRHEESECVCVDATMQATWYPGEVQWTGADSSGTAQVAGPGNPIKFELTKADDDVQLQGYFAPTVLVHLGDPARARIDPVQYLVKGEPFQVQVLMSQEEAKKRGDTVELKVRGKAGGAESVVKLTLAPQTRKNIIVRYEHQDWMTFNDRGKVFGKSGGFSPLDLLCAGYAPCVIEGLGGSPPPEFGAGTGRLDMSVKNAEEVEFALDKAVQSIRIYDSAAKLILARYDDTFSNLASFFNGVLSSAKSTADQRRAADRRFQLARHARAFVVDVPPEQVNDLIKVAVARLYYDNLIFLKVQQWYGIGGIPAPPANEYGFAWTSKEEERDVTNRIRFARSDTRDDVRDMGLDVILRRLVPIAEPLAFAVPAMAFHVTPFGDAYIVYTGQDILGHKVDLSDRIGAALNLGLSALTLGVDIASAIEEASRLRRSLRLGEDAVEFRELVGSAASPARSSIVATAEASNMDRLIEDALRSVERAPANMRTEEKIGLLRKEDQIGFLKQVYGNAEIEVRAAPPELHEIRNCQGRCRFEAADTIAFKKSGQKIDPTDAAKLRAEMDMADGTPIAKMEQNGGATNLQVRAYQNALGGWASSYVLTVPEISKAHREGFGVSVSVYLEQINGVHQVAVWDVEYGPVGRLLNRPKYFILHDSNFPEYLIRMRARDLDSILAKPGMRVLLQKRTAITEGVWRFETTIGPKGEKIPVVEPYTLSDTQKNTDIYWYPPRNRP